MKDKKNIIIIILMVLVVGVLAYFLLIGNKIAITSISLSEHNLDMFVGDSKKLEVSVLPKDATDKTLIWDSSNTGVVSVSNDGVVTANNSGEAIVTAKDKSGKISDKCTIKTFKKEADQLEFEEGNIELKINEKKTLSLNVSPKELEQYITWSSSDENIVTVDNMGNITGISKGTAAVKASYGTKEASINVLVIMPIEKIEIEKEYINIEVGNKEELKVKILPEEAADQLIKWESSDTSVAKVENGIVYGVNVGKATITGTLDGKAVTCQVTVIKSVTEIKINKTSLSMKKGSTEELTITVTPNDATNQNIVWKSSNEKVVKVDNGKLTGIVAGKATITGTIDGKTATCDVIVYNSPITSNDKYKSGYSTVSSYNSDTFKYRIQRKGDAEYTLVWVLDANKQWNSAFPKLGTRYAPKEILSKEISNYNYSKKGLVATNSSPFYDSWGDTPCTPFIINKGKVIRDIKNETYKTVYATIGMTSDGIIKQYNFSKNDYKKNLEIKKQMLSDGVRNSFATFGKILSSDTKFNGTTTCNTSNPKTYCFPKTVLCQVDNNNFVIFSGGKSMSYLGVAKVLKNSFNCSVAYAYDGGSSSSLYYKTGSMSKAQSIRNGQNIPDMMYFVEQ